MITLELLADMVDDCHNEKEDKGYGAEVCVECPLGSVCSEVANVYKCVQL
ncbi:hypothetical protein LCGC14_0611120 [marine sediment metagenome]|uniref:Uncharacterized protein n=1 Tax=marine sediment metagenome TaxID=412755 RepID=A0A0F9R7M0_9ZZZZ